MARTRTVLLDALGTLVELQPPAPRLRALLAEEGHQISDEQAEAGFAAEIAYYLAHHLEGRDAASLDELRARCAGVLQEALGLPGSTAPLLGGRCSARSRSSRTRTRRLRCKSCASAACGW